MNLSIVEVARVAGDRRADLVARLAAGVDAVRRPHTVLVGVDGVDGAGKTMFAGELGAALAARGRPVIRAGVDGFHQPRARRYARGAHSPDGFYLDSYDYPALAALLLDPLGPGGDGRYRTAAFDHRSDAPVHAPVRLAPPGAVLVLDGIFLHRPQLRRYWDLSVFLHVDTAVSLRRRAERDGTSPDPADNGRYVDGQARYLRECTPWRYATVVIDNNDLASPRLLAATGPSATGPGPLRDAGCTAPADPRSSA